MRHRLLLVTALCGSVLASTPLTSTGRSHTPDAATVLSGAIDALLFSGSFHVRDDTTTTASLTGPVASPVSGFVEGDVSISGPQAHLTYDQSLLGGVGEMLIAEDGNTYTRLVGAQNDLWHRAATSPFDVEGLATQARSMLAMPGAELTAADPVACPAAAAAGMTAACHSIHLTLPGSLLGMGPAPVPTSGAPGPTPQPAAVALDLLIDSDTLLPDTITPHVTLPGLGSAEHALAFTGYGVSVQVAAPPADQVTDEPFSIDDFTGASSPTP